MRRRGFQPETQADGVLLLLSRNYRAVGQLVQVRVARRVNQPLENGDIDALACGISYGGAYRLPYVTASDGKMFDTQISKNPK